MEGKFMRLALQRGCVAIVVTVFAAVGWAAMAGATPGPGSQVAATQWTTNQPPAVGSESYDGAVSCVSSTFCISTVFTETTTPPTPAVQQWDGSSWHTVALPVPTGATEVELEAVSCTSVSFCIAVGIQFNGSAPTPVVYSWNGAAWAVGPNPTLPSPYAEALLTGVSCTGPAWCMATGYAVNGTTTDQDTLAEEWNGTSWSFVATPGIADHTNDAFNDVSCTGPSNCMAVGSNSVTGGTGSDAASHGTQPAAGQSGFLGSAGPIANAHALLPSTNPHATVTTHILAEQWNGTAWTVTPTPDPTGVTSPQFSAVSCAGAGFCMATGYDESSSTDQGFAEEWSGGSWSPSALPAPLSGISNVLLGVSCISPTSCTAVGTAESDVSDTSISEVVLTGSWNGSTWTESTVATPSFPVAAWFGISCLGGGNCIASGGLMTGTGSSTTTLPLTGQAVIGRSGYRLAASDGGVFAYGPSAPSLGAPYLGSMGGTPLNAPVVGAAVTPSGDGYDLVASDGGVFNFGAAQFYGSTGGTHLNEPVVGMAMTADGGGYWLVASDGGVFSYGDAQFYGSTGGMHLNNPIVGMAATPNGLGYFLVASDGGIFAFGNAVFAGSEGGKALNKPVVGMAVTASGGYYLVASDGGIFTFGAPFLGSTGGTRLNAPVVGIGVTAGGYYLVGSDGGIFTFPGNGNPLFYGSAGGLKLSKPIVGIAA
jgi:hypothetical protein